MAEPTKIPTTETHNTEEAPTSRQLPEETESRTAEAMHAVRAEVAKQSRAAAAPRKHREPATPKTRKTPISPTEARVATAEMRAAVSVGEAAGRLAQPPRDWSPARDAVALLHDYPGQSLLVAAAAGFLAGAFLRRR